MTIREIKIGQKFTIGRGKTIWVKQTEQGMNNNYSYCQSQDYKKTRNPSRLTKMDKLFKQDTEINFIE